MVLPDPLLWLVDCGFLVVAGLGVSLGFFGLLLLRVSYIFRSSIREHQVGPHTEDGGVGGINGRFSKLFPGLFLIEIVIECTVESKAQGCDVYLNDTGFSCGCLVSSGGTQ